MSSMSAKYVKDCIYKQIRISPLCQAFIDTPEFQRLRFVKQCGHVHYVYQSAVHTRFEHSLGVMHLAKKMVKALRAQGANIDNRTCDLIQLAGLMHDIGHVAYSHFFDKFLEATPGYVSKIPRHHEERSITFLKQINDREKALSDTEVQFVTDAIRGDAHNENAYLYEVVCNKKCGLDVDKMDYLFRDAYHTGMHGFQSDYIIRNVRIADGHIAFSAKTEVDVKDLFDTRYRMYANVYRHHTVRKHEKIYWCLMKRLYASGAQIEYDTDIFLEYQLQTHFPEVFNKIWARDLNHDCEYCSDYDLEEPIHQSGNINQVTFI